jgi:hypothetical protein
MKNSVLLILFIFLYLFGNSQIVRADMVDNTLVNQYGNELQALKKKYNLPTAFGFSKSITNRDGQLNETIIVWYKTETGETEDKIVSARILHYKEGANKPKDSVIQKEVLQNGQKIIIRDTIKIIQRDTIMMEEIMNTDSLSFKTKRVLKNKSGYIITGNVNDRGNQIPVVLSTYKDDNYIQNGVDIRFSSIGYAVYIGNRPVGCIFPAAKSGGDLLFKVLKRNPEGWTNSQNDPCYYEEFIVTPDWWNGPRANMTWERQHEYMIINFPNTN